MMRKSRIVPRNVPNRIKFTTAPASLRLRTNSPSRHGGAHHGDPIAHEAAPHPEIPLRAERALDHGHAVDRAQDDVAEGRPIDLRALLVEVAQRDPAVLAHRTLEQALAPPAAAEQM